MKTIYVIFTVKEGYTFAICHDGNGGFNVQADAPDNMIVQWPTKEQADRIAFVNSVNGIVYEVKPVEVPA